MRKPNGASQGGFSLVELVLVVMIMGVIAAIAVPRLSRAAGGAECAAVAEHLRRLETAFMLYHAQNQAWPADTVGGQVPPEMVAQGYLNERDFAGNPLGGTYDWEQWGDPVKEAGGYYVSVSFVKDWEGALEVDRLIDDGDLKTGAVTNHRDTWLLLRIAR